MKTEAKASEKWTASEYLDDGRWGILNESNEIVVRISSGLTKEMAHKIVRAVNAHDALIEALEKAERAIQHVASIDDETRLGWALKEIESALRLAKDAKEKGKE